MRCLDDGIPAVTGVLETHVIGDHENDVRFGMGIVRRGGRGGDTQRRKEDEGKWDAEKMGHRI
jgi:hypothetical protein